MENGLPSTKSENFHELRNVVHEPAGILRPRIVEKRWGHEHIYTNEKYCLKNIFIKPGCSSSMHFHIHKHETILVQEGTLQLGFKDKDGNVKHILLHKGESIVIPPGFMHQLQAFNGSYVLLTEASTYDDPEDSIRVQME